MLSTIFSEKLNPKNVLPEYPRPNLCRDSYINLNGYWNYAFTRTKELPHSFQGKILVPFSPECALSGVNRRLEPMEYLWYELDFEKPTLSPASRLILHFGAVDQYAEVYINQIKIGAHQGGYLPFSMDITKELKDGRNSLHVMVKDVTDTSYHSRGKQKLHNGGMFYTAQSGIWQTVWMECVPDNYITDLKITPDYDQKQVTLELTTNKKPFWIERNSYETSSSLSNVQVQGYEENKILIYDGNILVAESSFREDLKVVIRLNNIKSWSPKSPFLYHVKVYFGKDSITSYFAMRKFSVAPDRNGIMRLHLNNLPYFHNGLLDQGYWPESLYTPPSDEAMIYDITTAKSLGYNLLRKHAKIEPLRWYYHCDRLGMLVWQDMVNGGSSYHTWFITYFPTICTHIAKRIKDNHYHFLSRSSREGRQEYIEETKQTIGLLYNYPCIAMWVSFNEAWGQFDTAKISAMIKKMDPTRTVDSASGWFDQKCGDVRSLHIYFTPFKFREEERTVVLSEFGGYVLRIPKHFYNTKTYGYRIYKTKKHLTNAFLKLYFKKIIPGISCGLSASVYTQLTDIEEEINGLLTYDRKVLKLSKRHIIKTNKTLYHKFKRVTSS